MQDSLIMIGDESSRSNKHLLHRHEEIHRPESRPFLWDPKLPRTDKYASLAGNHREKAQSPEQRVSKMHYRLVEA